MSQPAAPNSLPILPLQSAVVIQREEVGQVMLAMFSAIGFAVSARFMVFLSVLGATALAVMAMRAPTMMAIVTLAVFCVLTVLPLVFLEISGKRGI